MFFALSVLCGFYWKMQQSYPEDHLCPTPAGLLDPQEDDGNHDLREADKWLERGGQ